ncbi:MAG: hypothetical protein IJT58_04815 [Synergistaceae bacterium]|nr:hypothetical protein [Synergistaceae bacterium]
MFRKKTLVSISLILVLLLTLCAAPFAEAAAKSGKKEKAAKPKNEPEPPSMRAWSHETTEKSDDGSQVIKLRATYYSNEYVEQLIASEAEKNLWTKDEMENYKYTLLKNLNLGETIPFHIYINIQGIPMYPGQFDKHITMMVRGKKYSPIDYDRRLNFKILGDRDGIVYFPRYDEKTGKAILEGAKDIRIIFDKSISYALTGRAHDVLWVWDLGRDRGSITGGKAADRLEIDRLQKRTDKLAEERRKLQQQMDALNKEYAEINSRIDELQSK